MDSTLFPSGSVTLICCWSPSIIVACASVIKKLLVAPESKISHRWMFSLLSVILLSNAAAAPAKPYVRHCCVYDLYFVWLLSKPGGAEEFA